MNNEKFKNFLAPRRQPCKKASSLFDTFYNYFKENMIVSVMFLINLIGVAFFLIYFFTIEYIPNLDFSGLVYLVIIMATVGLYLSAILYFFFVIPGLAWKELSSLLTQTYRDSNILSRMAFPNLFLFIFVYIISSIIIWVITLYVKDATNQIIFAGLSLLVSSLITCILTAKINFKSIGKFFLIYVLMTGLLTFPIIGTYLVVSDKKDLFSIIIFFITFGLGTNVIVVQNKQYSVLLSILLLFFALIIFNPKLIPFEVVKKLHIGNFNSSIVLDEKYCSVLKSFDINSSEVKNKKCYIQDVKVHWRVGKEALVEIEDQNITIPSDQIISMAWPIPKISSTHVDKKITQSSIIAFEFNSTILTKNGKEELLKKVLELAESTKKEITIYGCSSPEGTEKFNTKLALQRAKSIGLWIDGYLSKSGKDLKITVIGEGTSKHCSDPNFEKELKDHRKVVIK